MSERYPLEAARTLRAHEEDAAKTALAAGVAGVAHAERARADAEAELARHRAETRAVADRERAADQAGRTVAESMRAGAFVDRRRVEQASVEERVGKARAAESTAHAALAAARDALARARSEREAVERHHEAWLAERRKRTEARDEDDADDVIAARPRDRN